MNGLFGYIQILAAEQWDATDDQRKLFLILEHFDSAIPGFAVVCQLTFRRSQ